MLYSILTEDFGAHLANGLLIEEWKGFRDSVEGDPLTFESNLLHGIDLIWALEGKVLLGVERHSLCNAGPINQGLGQLVCRPSSSSGRRANDLRRVINYGGMVGNGTRHRPSNRVFRPKEMDVIYQSRVDF